MKSTTNLISRNALSTVIFIISIIVIGIACFKIDINEITFDKESSYNLLTVNTIFAGFLYTTLGNMVEFSSRPKIVSKDQAGYIDKYFSPVYFGLFFFIISILLDVLLLFFSITWMIEFLVFFSRSFSLVGLLYFIISSFMLRKAINQLRNK